MDHRPNRMRRACVTATLFVSLLIVPAVVSAEATITGTASVPTFQIQRVLHADDSDGA